MFFQQPEKRGVETTGDFDEQVVRESAIVHPEIIRPSEYPYQRTRQQENERVAAYRTVVLIDRCFGRSFAAEEDSSVFVANDAIVGKSEIGRSYSEWFFGYGQERIFHDFSRFLG